MIGDYATRFQDALIKHIDNRVKEKGEHLVINRQMTNDDVHWHRGYIAAHLELGIYVEKDLTKKMNEE